MRSIVLVAAVCVAIALARPEKEYQDAFTSFMQKYQKSYHSDEFAQRYAVFKANYDFIDNWNSQNQDTVLAVNGFADLTNTEFSRLYNGLRLKAPISEDDLVVENTVPGANPASWDWVAQGAVTGIKNQGQCGSCWSFSTTGSTEGCNKINRGRLVGLSEQNIMDCSTAYGNMGCDGGLMTEAMLYIINNKGVDTEASYPYTAEDGTCHFSTANIGGILTGMQNVTQGSEADLQNKVYVGPTSIAIDASQTSFQFYSSGVYYDPNCSSTQLDHGVLAVGWGTLSGKDYWKVKNSWGTDWGLQGYILMARNRNNACGVATMATLPTC